MQSPYSRDAEPVLGLYVGSGATASITADLPTVPTIFHAVLASFTSVSNPPVSFNILFPPSRFF